jgi:pimeloyl-ACP methyl ester carboxylesterase
MATTIIDGITTRYEIIGSGPPLLMFSPAGFDATLEKWTTQGVYATTKMLDHLAARYSCIIFDRREAGRSGGRVERITWAHYVAQGKGLLEHLKIRRAHLLGGCMGCCPVVAFAVAHPEMVASMILYWPVGGAKYRISSRKRFSDHLTFVQQHGLEKVVSLVAAEGKTFNADPRGGPWASVIKNDPVFAQTYANQNVEEYMRIVMGMCETLFDRESAPGAEPEDLFAVKIRAFIVPGRDSFHATSAARYLEECLPQSEYWDIPVPDQTEGRVPERLLNFLDSIRAEHPGST